MTTVAVICEYDPFHRGHREQLTLLREHFGEDCILLSLMSGSTVQRGRLATYPKHTRAAAALACGSDLVLELPAPYSSAGAEHFATGAVRLLDRLGGVDVLAFGSECGELSILSETAEVLLSEPYRRALAALGHRISHAKAVEELLTSFDVTAPTTPNDILAVEYLAALRREGSAVRPFTYRRKEGFSAAEARRLLYSHCDPAPMIPPEALALFERESLTDPKAYESIALHTLRETPLSVLESYYGMNGGVAGLLQRTAQTTATFTDLIAEATCRAYPSARLRRAALSAVLAYSEGDRTAEPLFTNLLGASEAGRHFLRERKRSTSLTIVTKPADGLALPAPLRAQFEKTCRADRLMTLCRGESPAAPLRTGPVLR